MLTFGPSVVSSLFVLATASLAKADADHFILTRLSSIAFARLDPIVSPGKVSGHVHNILGGSCFSQNLNTPEEQQACDCSSAIIGDDRSNYWSPALYYQDKNGTFSPILSGNRIYYFTKSEDVKPFPPGLRMISGLAGTRNASDTHSFGVKISCNHGLQTQYLPNGTSHPEGCGAISLGIYFPSCGLANGTLDSEDHFSHMAWPLSHQGGGLPPYEDVNGALCPESHPIKYPTIFMEANYYPSSEQPWHSGNPVILSTGDQSGLGYHADFVNGWNQQVLTDTIAQCGLGKGPGDQLTECAPLAKSRNETATWYCRYQNQIPNEDVGYFRPLDNLPGCNKVWPTDGPDVKPACEEENPPAFVYPDVEFVNLLDREHIPMAFTLAQNISNVRYEFVPSLGETGASYFLPWGIDATNKASLKSSTVEELLAAANATEDESCE
ncbi:hypothetical protein SCHPADRAFT_831049 [Schizopora paradoxa]|uniref:DUF1996 domain-containing protein n=1 Tax=Schizopora paradoxa TaxID=27342 RepID=A0A0H2RIN8_9AGAM|nr:hypothetical protein SCHPADRAFT_831049 [Schizopora paradoxa]